MYPCKQRKTGFTLVEVIVILVILAILAAILIPAMTGWIDKAKEKRLIVGCRTCVESAQTLASEKYGVKGAANFKPTNAEVEALAEVKGSVDSALYDNATAKVLMLVYSEKGDSCTYYANGANGPYYQYGARSASLANDSVKALSDAYLAKTNNKKIDSASKDVAGTLANLLWNSLTIEQRAALDGMQWSFNPNSNTDDGTKLRIFMTNGVQTNNGKNVEVYKYNPATGQYQFTPNGSISAKNEVSANTSVWSPWCDSLETAREAWDNGLRNS